VHKGCRCITSLDPTAILSTYFGFFFLSSLAFLLLRGFSVIETLVPDSQLSSWLRSPVGILCILEYLSCVAVKDSCGLT
jgi:hypothetical protein